MIKCSISLKNLLQPSFFLKSLKAIHKCLYLFHFRHLKSSIMSFRTEPPAHKHYRCIYTVQRNVLLLTTKQDQKLFVISCLVLTLPGQKGVLRREIIGLVRYVECGIYAANLTCPGSAHGQKFRPENCFKAPVTSLIHGNVLYFQTC